MTVFTIPKGHKEVKKPEDTTTQCLNCGAYFTGGHTCDGLMKLIWKFKSGKII